MTKSNRLQSLSFACSLNGYFLAKQQVKELLQLHDTVAKNKNAVDMSVVVPILSAQYRECYNPDNIQA